MYTLSVENYRGERLQLVPNNNYIVELEGLTDFEVAINTTIAGNSSGSVYNSSRTEEREIPLSIMPRGDVEKNRIALYRYFVAEKPVKIFYKNGSRDVFIEGRVQKFGGSLFSDKETLDLSVLCPQPYWQSVSEIVTDISDVLPAFSFPFAIEADGIPFSEIEKGLDKVVVNNGDVESGIIIEMQADGEVINPIIYDAYGGSFALNYTMQAGDLITINTYKGQKSVKLLRDGKETYLFKYVAGMPTWFLLEPGDNTFTHSTESGSEFLQIRYRFFNLYEGV